MMPKRIRRTKMVIRPIQMGSPRSRCPIDLLEVMLFVTIGAQNGSATEILVQRDLMHLFIHSLVPVVVRGYGKTRQLTMPGLG